MGDTAARLLTDGRTRSGLSRRALAAKAGVPTSTVSRIEDNESDPTVTMLERLLAAAGARLVTDIAAATNSPPTLASLATALDNPGGRLRIDWTRLRGFVDWATRHPELVAASIADPPVRTSTPLDAILAALAEQLADDHNIQRPAWTRAIGPLPDEWSPPMTPRMRATATAATPEPFRRRNLVLAKTALFRHAV